MTPAQMIEALAAANTSLADRLGASPYMSAGLTLTEHGWTVSAFGASIQDTIRTPSCADPEAAFAAFGQLVDALPCPKARALAQYEAAISAAAAMGIDIHAPRQVAA